MISVNDFRTGSTIEVENDIWRVVEFQHVKPGKGAAFVRSKLRNLRTGHIQEKTFRAAEKVKRAHVERQAMQYLYESGDMRVFMNMESFNQIEIPFNQIEDELKFLKENLAVDVLIFEDEVVGLELPKSIELTVVETDPGIKGNTVSGGSKPAVLETGLTVQVPLFINVDDQIVVNTTEGKYVSRV